MFGRTQLYMEIKECYTLLPEEFMENLIDHKATVEFEVLKKMFGLIFLIVKTKSKNFHVQIFTKQKSPMRMIKTKNLQANFQEIKLSFPSIQIMILRFQKPPIPIFLLHFSF